MSVEYPHLDRALALARAAVGLASPNPTVGCVLAHGTTVLGEGAHLYDARDHAEIVALKQVAQQQAALKGTSFSSSISPVDNVAALAAEGLRGATAYVTLEPCSHLGRTGPCADALIAARIARCVIATVDPNPLVRGNGITKLRAAGIEVVLATGELAADARRLNDAFACFIQHQRPFVTLKAALSVDGKLAPPPSTRVATAPHWVTGEAARASAQPLRHSVDAVLTGIGTVLADDPLLTDRTGLPRRRPLLRVVLDRALRTPLDSRLVSTAAGDLLLVCSDEASTARESALLAHGAEVLRIAAHDGRLELTALFAALAERKLLSVLVEAGAAVNGALLQADLVDKLVLYYAERELGHDAVPFSVGYESPYVVQQRLTKTTRETFPSGNGEDVRIAGYLHDPWTDIH